MLDRVIATYRDGLLISAYRGSFGDVGYCITSPHGELSARELILDEREARELAAALTWIISEVDKKNGKPSFRPPTKRGAAR